MNIEAIQEGQIVDLEFFNEQKIREKLTAKILAVGKNRQTIKIRGPRGVFKTLAITDVKRIVTNPDGSPYATTVLLEEILTKVVSENPDAEPKEIGEKFHEAVLGTAPVVDADKTKEELEPAEKLKQKKNSTKTLAKAVAEAEKKDPVVAVLEKIRAREEETKQDAEVLHKAANIMDEVAQASEDAQKRLLELKPSLRKQAEKAQQRATKTGTAPKPLRVSTKLFSGQALKDKVLELALAGKSNKEISETCGVHQSTVSETKAKLVKEGKLVKK
jgi:ATP/maltotriose-dependent transcriptional regulator MalT